ncbi:hypothetical protein ACFQU2_29175 [Siccirubricoccus deserti]
MSPSRLKPDCVSPGCSSGITVCCSSGVRTVRSRVKAALCRPSETSMTNGCKGASSRPRLMPSRSFSVLPTTSKRQASASAKVKVKGPSVSGSVTASVPMTAPIAPAVTAPPVAKRSAVGAVSSRSSTVT